MARRGKKSHTSTEDEVNHPKHYNAGAYETIDVREDIAQFYPPIQAILVSEVITYLSRAPHKGEKVKDLKKAQWYLNRLVDKAERGMEK